MSRNRKLHWRQVGESHRSACGAWGALYFAPSLDRINCQRCRALLPVARVEEAP